MKKTLVVLLVLFSSLLFAQDFPEPVGYVNDFANIIEDSSEDSLEQTLRAYEENTSIEIAVITVNSLENLTVEDYTIRLAESWGVGKSDKDNGVIFLVAPNERKTRIEVGYGLEPDLTDAMSRRIIEGVILPAFRDGNMSGGTVSGAEAIIAGLGNTPFEQRAEERRLAEEERQREIAKAKAAFLRFVFGLILIIIILTPFFLLFLLYRKVQRLKRIQEKNEEDLAYFIGMLSKANKKFKDSGPVIISALRDEFDNTEWATTFTSVSQSNLVDLNEKTNNLEQLTQQKRSWMKAIEYSTAIEILNDDLYEIEKVLISAGGILDSLRSKRNNWPHQLDEFHDLFDDVEKLSNHPDSGNIANDALRARKEIGKAIVMTRAESSTVNWTEVAVIAAAAIASIRKVYNTANENIAFAKKARQEGPELLASFPEELDEAVEKLSKSYVSQTAKDFYAVAKERYEQAAEIASNKGDNWVVIFIALQNARTNLEAALSQAKNDKPKPRPKRRRSSSSNSSSIVVGGGWSSGSSSGGSFGGGGFGGFGGGGFGGGGASGSW